MSEEGYTHRPYGEAVVHIENRPYMRFGSGVTFAVKEGSQTWVGKVMEGGTILYKPAESGMIVEPTLWLDENEMAALAQAVMGQPIRMRGEAAHDHLQDAISLRDRLLAMVEKEWSARTEGVK